MEYNFDDFTEDSYRELIKLAKENYKFINYIDYQQPGRNILWRHDVDFSMHRAYRLAQIENEEGVVSTFFVSLHCEFYNLLEAEISELVSGILKLGHKIGLHFDPDYYKLTLLQWDDFLHYLDLEKNLLQNIFDTEINALSFHNPDTGGWYDCNRNEICDMVNAYSVYFKQNYGYCSDSNGYWRFRRLRDVLLDAEDEKLQVLTHPGWWTPEVLSPRERIARCINGRAKKQHSTYDENLRRACRLNLDGDIHGKDRQAD